MLRACAVCVVVSALAVVVVCGATHSSSSSLLNHDPSKTLMKRDYALPAEPVASDPVPGVGDNGFYYYYYPVEEGGKGKGKGELGYKDDHYKCTGEKLLAPLIIICIFLGIIAARDIGLVPSFNLPAISIPDVTLNKARDLASSASDYMPWGAIENVTVTVLAAVESEECVPWMVCESGRLAEGRTVALGVMEALAPRKYQPHVKIFKDSALKQTNCDSYKCGYFKKPLCALLQAWGGEC